MLWAVVLVIELWELLLCGICVCLFMYRCSCVYVCTQCLQRMHVCQCACMLVQMWIVHMPVHVCMHMLPVPVLCVRSPLFLIPWSQPSRWSVLSVGRRDRVEGCRVPVLSQGQLVNFVPKCLSQADRSLFSSCSAGVELEPGWEQPWLLFAGPGGLTPLSS